MTEKSNLNKGTPVYVKKGYTAPPTTSYAQEGYKPAVGQLGSPPTTGSVVSKPPQTDKK